jgi:hypothetical protein
MTGIVWFGAMAGRLTAAPDDSANRTWAKISQAKKLFLKLGALGFEGSESVGHGALSERIYTLRIMPQKKKNCQTPLLRRTPMKIS